METTLEPCQHAETELRRRKYANGTEVASKQCLNCGAAQGCVPVRSVNFSALPLWDNALVESWKGREKQWYEARRLELEDQRSRKQGDWWAWYNQYLESPEWQTKRLAVLARERSICQGCGGRASQAHHLTYDRAGCEMLFDLVAICQDCHEKIHAKDGAE